MPTDTTMIELLTDKGVKYAVEGVDEIIDEKKEFVVIQFHDCKPSDIDWLVQHYGLDLSIMSRFEDIEISSHFLEYRNQASFHFSLPYYNREGKMVEEPVFIVISLGKVFLFTSAVLDNYLSEIYSNKFLDIQKLPGLNAGIHKFPFEFVSDYYADITEGLAKKVKVLANKVLIESDFTDEDMNLITTYSFNNLLVKEAVNEAIRIFNRCKKSDFGKAEDIRSAVSTELEDLVVVSDYIQFNLERLRDLRDHINNKIDLEQSRIFKILTVATVCIALPTMVAGVYGMNFDIMPELHWIYGYPVVVSLMVLCAILPYLYFKRKKWL